MTNVYALWLGSGAPPGSWSLVSDVPEGKYLIHVNTALGTYGSATHNHSLTGTNSLDAYDATGVYGHYAQGASGVRAQGITHNHTLSSVTITEAANDPSYYTFRVIKCEIGAFINSVRSLPRDAVMASTSALSASGISRHTASDGRLVRLSASSSGSVGGSDTHKHLLGADVSDATLTTIYLDNTSTPYDLIGGGFTTHLHTFTGIYTPEATSKPARVITRLYRVTDTTTSVIPANAVLWVDGSITGYTSFFEVLSDWYSPYYRYLEGGDQDATLTGSPSHNHGSEATGNTGPTNRTAGARHTTYTGDINYCILAAHTHIFHIGLSTSSVSISPPAWSLIPIKVKANINISQTFTKAFSMDTLLKKTRTVSGSFSLILHKAGFKYTSMDVALKKYGVTKAHSMDAIILKNRQATNQMDVMLQRRRLLSAYLMSLAPLFAKNKKYTMSTRLVYEDIPAIYPVIDVLYSSYADQFDKIHKKIVTAGLDLSLDTSGSSALDNRWGRAFGLPREPGENDTYYRRRLLAFTASTTGCGTKKALQDVLNVASDGDSTQIDVFPGQVLIRYTDPLQLKRAKAREGLINDLLAASVAAGVEYLTPYPFVEFSLDVLLKKTGLTLDYSSSMLLQITRDTGYTMDALFRGKVELGYEMDAYVQRTLSKSYAAGFYLRRDLSKTYTANLTMKKAIPSPYEMSLRMRKIEHRNLLIDALLQKTKKKTTSFNTTLKWVGERSYALSALFLGRPTLDYSMSTIIVNRPTLGYGMGLEIIGGS